ncbi:MAG: hypothetical protein DMD34_05305 [Gemmatimonadetes bacterium]|nr:MAG: hypothetical protein DMD34_05305 [Gemmatimonadota bacterium]
MEPDGDEELPAVRVGEVKVMQQVLRQFTPGVVHQLDVRLMKRRIQRDDDLAQGYPDHRFATGAGGRQVHGRELDHDPAPV